MMWAVLDPIPTLGIKGLNLCISTSVSTSFAENNFDIWPYVCLGGMVDDGYNHAHLESI